MIIAISCVNDLIFWSCDKNKIHIVAMKLHNIAAYLKQETDTAGFLGIQMEHDPATDLLEMKQEGLIQ